MPLDAAAHEFDPGYAASPFAELVAAYPGEEVYPPTEFRLEWGPIFHRGRLDGTARVLVLGQDPAAQEAITRRILVGVAGQRVQGLLARVGITRSYVMVNTFVYSVYGQRAGDRHRRDTGIAAYREKWLDALLLDSRVEAVVTFGTLARYSYRAWAKSRAVPADRFHHAALLHPTYPDAVSGDDAEELATTTRRLLANWNRALPGLRAAITPDEPDTPLKPPRYGTGWVPTDLAPIPEADMPAGLPAWMRDLDPWAQRTGADAAEKRATITVTIPAADRTWEAG